MRLRRTLHGCRHGRPASKRQNNCAIVTGDDFWSSLLVLFALGPAHAFANEFDPMAITDEAIQDGVGIRGAAYHLKPTVHGELRDEDG